MDFIECEKPQGAGYCSDNECSCTPTPFTEGQGFIYISEEVVQFRKEALSLAAVQKKIEQLSAQSGEYISMSRYAPILICEAAAKRRNLSLAAASEDAILFWGSGIVPLRATPLQKPESSTAPFEDTPGNNVVEPEPQNLKKENPKDSKTTDRFIPEILPPTLPNTDRPQRIEPLSVSEYPPVDYSSETTISSKPLNKAVDRLFSANLQPPSNNQDVSVDDVVAQYESGPLGEMAKKMAMDLNGKSDESENKPANPTPVSDSPGWETRLGISNPSKPKTQASNFSYTFSGESPISDTILSAKKSNDQIVNVSQNKKKKDKVDNRLLLYITIPILALTIICSVVVVVWKFSKPEQKSPVVTSPVQNVIDEPVAAPQTIEISNSFFLFQYTFDDGLYEGDISFSGIETNKGKYTQNVRQKGKTKVRTVKGSFTYSVQGGITFRPDGYQSNIVWVLEDMDPTGKTAVFIDPLQENRETTKVHLTRKD